MVTVSIQGYKGSFHDMVAAEIFPERDVLERSTFKEVFADVSEGRADYAVAAIENSIAGAILENYNLLKNSGVHIVGEYYLRIVHNLIVMPGTKLEDITEVWSHPMALKQCQSFLQSRLPHAKQVETDDTARSATRVKEMAAEMGVTSSSDKVVIPVAAIASKLAAEINEMEILAPGIEDDPQNYTRFLILTKSKDTHLSGAKTDLSTKTSIYVETAHKPGGLLPVLQILKDSDANMTMLVSRPIVGKAWEYGFYIDFIFKQSVDPLVEKLRGVVDELQLLGTYADYSAEVTS